ncbi:hypothetical protein FM038_25925 [Shewanella eurypsychrophilus]|uniref:Uncharacterized protein n=1 Tax=Shewanella eurypsychrophilus TaxID=2593656 RepID=A0ABX8S3B7_9GAMM|nr:MULTISPECIES: hypothetical protein [Shewanella]QXP44907.1 hypothetical protein FM038_25925 [Shewanella eurypsychrophilus]
MVIEFGRDDYQGIVAAANHADMPAKKLVKMIVRQYLAQDVPGDKGAKHGRRNEVSSSR